LRDIAAETLSVSVPCAIVQPLVQFALKNLEPGAGTLTLTIEAKAEADKVRIRLVDQGKPRPEKWELASIVQKVKDRLRSKYKDAARLVTYKEQPEGALFTLEIPSAA
jgi:LytS/YehU family sensor histidine kinase